MFLDADKKGYYWVTGAACNVGFGFCSARYYWTALDGSDQQQVWKWLKGTTDRIALSPDGKWLAYQVFLSNQKPESYKNGCYLASMDGSQVQQLPGTYPSCYSESHQTDFWSPDGQSFVYDTRNEELQKFPLHSFSAAQKITTDLPDVQAPMCGDPHWMPDGNRIFFASCQSNFMGNSIPTSSRMVDLTTSAITTYPGTGFCGTSFSPDGRSVFLHHCSSDAEGQRVFHFYTLDLETATLTPLFTDTLNTSQENAYWIGYAPVPWEAWSH
jgi:Tol biopolymer transport system component